MKSTRHVAAAAAATLLFLAAGIAPAPAPADDGKVPPVRSHVDLVPPGRVLLFDLEDPERACSEIAGTDFGRVAKLFVPFWNQLWGGLRAGLAEPIADLEKETGLTYDELVSLAGGGFSFALVDLVPGEEPVFAFSYRGGASRRATVDKFVAMLRRKTPPVRKGEASTYEVAGVRVDLLGSDPTVHGFWLDDNFDLPNAKPLAESMIRTPAAPLSRDPGFQAVRAKIAPGTAPLFYLYVNPRPILAMAAERGTEAERAVLADLSLMDFGPSGIGAGARDGKLEMALHVGASGPSRRGLFALLPAAPVDVAAAAALAPPSAVSFSACELDLAQAWDAFVGNRQGLIAFKKKAEEMGRELSVPEKLRLELTDLDADFDLRDGLLASLGSQWASFSFVPEGGAIPETIVSVAVRDRQKLEAGLARLAGAIGHEIASVPGPGSGAPAISYLRAPLGKLGREPERGVALWAGLLLGLLPTAYAFEGDRLVLGWSPQAVAEYLEWLRQPVGGKKADLRANPAFQAELAKAPGGGKGLSAFGFDDPRLIPAGYELLAKVLKLGEPFVRAAGVDLDLALLPRARALAAELRPGSSYVLAGPDGYTFAGRTTIGSAAVAGVVTAGLVAVTFLGGRSERVEAEARAAAPVFPDAPVIVPVPPPRDPRDDEPVPVPVPPDGGEHREDPEDPGMLLPPDRP